MKEPKKEADVQKGENSSDNSAFYGMVVIGAALAVAGATLFLRSIKK